MKRAKRLKIGAAATHDKRVLRKMQDCIQKRHYVMTLNMKEIQSEAFICDVCGKEGAKIRRVSRSYGWDKNLLAIENVPAIGCPHCGESYLAAETLHDIERIKRNRQTFAESRPVPVAVFV
jgi:YgiT-type zinc finger domain-containing protein